MADGDTSDMTPEDMSFEIKRLAQKLQVLENDKLILQEEALISQTVKSAKSSDDGDVARLTMQLSQSRSLLTMCATKYKVVKTFLDLERKALAEVRMEMCNSSARIMKEMEMKMNTFKDTVLVREAALQHRFQRVNQELFRSKETAERLKVELHEARNDRRTLQKNLDEVDAELTIEKNKLKGQFESISSKIEMYQKEHAKEVKRLNDTMLEKEQQRQEHEDELAKWKMTLKLRVEEKLAVDKQLADLQALRALEEARAAESLKQEQTTLQEEQAANKQLREENADLRGRLETLQVQQGKLLDTHDALQSDFKSLLAREKTLRAELSDNSSDKGEMKRKLRSITEKVSSMEEDHARELGDVRAVVEQKQLLLDSALEGREREGARAENLAREVARVQSLLAESASRVDGVNAELREMGARKEGVERKLLDVEREKAEMQAAIDGLRSDRDDALNQSLQVQADMKKVKTKLSQAESEARELSKKLKDDSSKSSEVTRLEAELLRCEEKVQQQSDEVKGLKDTVRRECEERTELMVELSELKDRLARLQRQQQRGAGMRSQSGGVDSSVQARQEFTRHTEGGERPGMLRQLTGSDSTPHSMAGGSGQSGQGRQEGVSEASERDDRWSKQRQAAQQGSGKPKRVSKYRP
mmetsp:Transcript_25937/g.48689  ORF Transcript_25937/g.48689 Transcript_25937/m.48689 type:complete len:646 (+) Transcript_25937:54-1991(+)